MKLQKIIPTLSVIFVLSSCAAGYKTINPNSLNYQSTSMDKGVTVDYKYGLLSSRYAKKETNNKIRLVAIKVTNNSGKDLIFGKNIKLTFTNNNEIALMDENQTYSELKQGWAGYLFYLLLTPATLNVNSNGTQSSTPIGYVLGPGLAAGNIIAASSANNNFKDELTKYDISGSVIKNGDSVYGLVGFKSDTFDAIKVRVD
ncbi:MAG TPA: hypothetical protein VGN20_28500 [Mucilaginibacter sp.]|jgi:hypothetical protein